MCGVTELFCILYNPRHIDKSMTEIVQVRELARDVKAARKVKGSETITRKLRQDR